jgi:hypothetical protein
MKNFFPHPSRKYLTFGVFSLLSLTLFVTGALYADGPSPLYTRCGGENEICILGGSTEVAYGAQGIFSYKRDIIAGTQYIMCSNSAF